MTSTRRVARSSILFGALLLCAAPAFARPQPQAAHAPRSMQQSVESTATITAIDKATRAITLKLDDGTTTEILAGPEVKRFDEMAVGDKVHARYTIGVTSELRAPTEDEKLDPLVVVEGGARAANDAAPAAGAGRMIRVVATVEAIDLAMQTATLKGPNGNSMVVDVADPALLEAAKLGDTVVVTVAESVALSLEKVSAPKAKAKAKKGD